MKIYWRFKMKKHYVYRISNIILKKHYYGSRSCSIDPKNDLGIKYFSSSSDKDFKEDQIKNKENYKYKIIKIFDNRVDALELEVKLHKKFNVGMNGMFYNKVAQTSVGFDSTGKVSVKDSKGNTFQVSKNDPRYLSGELVGISLGTVAVKDKKGRGVRVSKNDTRYLSGELVSILTGTVIVKNDAGRMMQVSLDDIRYLSGELVGYSKGEVVVKNHKGDIFRVKQDDPRYLSGELVGVWKGRKHKSEFFKKQKQTFDEIKHQQGSKNSQFGTCWIYNLELKTNKKIKKEELNSFINEGWKQGRKMSF